VGRIGAVALVAVITLVALLGGCLGAVAGQSASSADGGSGGGVTGSAGPEAAVPADWELLEEDAAATCPVLPWSVLAAIGRVESDSGRSSARGVASGANAAGAEGPMQFEPATFAGYATVGPGGADPPSPYDAVDAVYTAARLLCADGGGSAATLSAAVYAYNHASAYVNAVLVIASALQVDPMLDATAATALQFAADQLGSPYEWGGTGAGGFDCSGLAQASYRSAGLFLPRVAQDQFDAGPQLTDDQTVQPGDLVFFGSSASSVDHVGIYVAAGEMIDAPHTGADVRVETLFSSEFVGATRPG
jgi:cell wall-associated NlpC family hydrolase